MAVTLSGVWHQRVQNFWCRKRYGYPAGFTNDRKHFPRTKSYQAMLSELEILTALRDCFDPEVKLNLVDLGLIYGIETGPDPDSTPAWPRQWVKVTMTLTTEFCPASGLILEQVHNRLATISGISKVDVSLVWEPKWTPHRISEAGRKQLGI